MKRYVIMILTLTMLMIAALAAQHQSSLEPDTHKGKVIGTMDSGGYTYVEFEENGEKLWAATMQFKVSVGDIIEFSKAAPMKNFYSKTLNRTFALVLFVNHIKVQGSTPGSTPGKSIALPEGHVPIGKKSSPPITVEPGSVKKAQDGFTVAECYAGKDSLAGKTVRVRGRVVKFTPRIMETNWIHLQDGTGEKGSNDLTVTSKETVKVGDLVLVSGKIAYNRNFGAGYIYPVIIEDAAVTVE